MSEHYSEESNVNAAMKDLRDDLEAAAAEEWIHSTYEDLQGYVDGTLSEPERDIVESHIEVCAECGASERDLLQIRQELRTTPRGQIVWWQVAAAAAAVILVAYIAMLPMRDRVSRLEAQIKTLEEEKSVLEKQSRESALLAQDLQKKAANPPAQALAPEYRQVIAAVLAGKELTLPSFLSDLRAPEGQLLGSARKAEFSLIGPVGTAVESETPVLEWTPWNGADTYVVSVFDTRFELVAQSEALSTAQWTIPRPLKRGSVYAWQVVATRKGRQAKSPMPPAPPAMFKVLEPNEAAKLSAVRQQIEAPLQLGILYSHFGVLDAAEEQFRRVDPSDPSSPTATRLLQQLESLGPSK